MPTTEPLVKKKITFDFTSASGKTDITINNIYALHIDFIKNVIGVDYYSNGPHYYEVSIDDLETTDGWVVANL